MTTSRAAAIELRNKRALDGIARSLRGKLDRAFRPDTAAQGFSGKTPSTGHCAAVSAIVHHLLGGELISARVKGMSHWFNRIKVRDRCFDVDLTGDQFEFPPIRIEDAGKLFPGGKSRACKELNVETLCRARLLAERAGLKDAHDALLRTLQDRPAPSDEALK